MHELPAHPSRSLSLLMTYEAGVVAVALESLKGALVHSTPSSSASQNRLVRERIQAGALSERDLVLVRDLHRSRLPYGFPMYSRLRALEYALKWLRRCRIPVPCEVGGCAASPGPLVCVG